MASSIYILRVANKISSYLDGELNRRHRHRRRRRVHFYQLKCNNIEIYGYNVRFGVEKIG